MMNSTAFEALISLQVAAADAAARSYEVGLIQRTPVPELQPELKPILECLTLSSINLKRALDTANELSHIFIIPALLQSRVLSQSQKDGMCEQSDILHTSRPSEAAAQTLADGITAWNAKVLDAQRQLADNQRLIDDAVFNLYGITGKDRQTIEARAATPQPTEPDDEHEEMVVDAPRLTLNTLSYLLGGAFGRWDIRYATGNKQPPDMPDPFAPLPVCPPGMLQNADGRPAESQDVSDDYPLRITWPGILANDDGHPEDIVARLREALALIWPQNAGDIEQEACDILGVKTLRDYVGKPAKFFADHLKRYSKSRRQAPIYWPLSTTSGSYTLWLYYHRLSDQTLYTCVNDFVNPKLQHVSDSAAALRRKEARSTAEERNLTALLDLEAELRDFRDELLRIAQFWKPDLNDGVQITAAPLWKLFRLPKWQKTLKKTWSELEQGKYDWSHLACAVWPERVAHASRKDRSYAIAHSLEDALWEEVETTTKRGKVKTQWQPKLLSKEEIQQIIQTKER